MYLEQLRSLLSEGGIAPDNVQRLAALCDEWFNAEPGLETFVFRSIFRELALEWDDPQGIPTARHTPFKEALLPQLRKVANLTPAKDQRELVASLESLAKSFHDCCSAARREKRPLK